MNKDYTDIQNTTIAEYTVALRNTEEKILETLRNKNLKDLKAYIKLYFKLSKLLDKKHSMVENENSRKPRQ